MHSGVNQQNQHFTSRQTTAATPHHTTPPHSPITIAMYTHHRCNTSPPSHLNHHHQWTLSLSTSSLGNWNCNWVFRYWFIEVDLLPKCVYCCLYVSRWCFCCCSHSHLLMLLLLRSFASCDWHSICCCSKWIWRFITAVIFAIILDFGSSLMLLWLLLLLFVLLGNQPTVTLTHQQSGKSFYSCSIPHSVRR